MTPATVEVGHWISTTVAVKRLPDLQYWCEVFCTHPTDEEASRCEQGMPVGPIDAGARFTRYDGKLWVLALDEDGFVATRAR